MADPYWRYAAAASAAAATPGGGAQTAFPGYLISDNSTLASRGLFGNSDLRGAASDYLHKDMLALNDTTTTGTYATPVLGGLPLTANVRKSTPLEDPALVSRDAALGINPGITGGDRSSSLRKSEGLHEGESNMLIVEGLPNDCTRREVAHLFRPFIGFKEIRVIHKEPRKSGDKARVLCFVEFTDANCARTALEALQGYKFDDSQPDAPTLKIQFAHFPFRPGAQ